jgi:hypothetical protein
MTSNSKRAGGTLDKFFIPRKKKTKSTTNIDISGTSSFLVTPNEDSFDFSVDSQIQDVLKVSNIWPTLWTKEQVIEFHGKNPWLNSKNGKLGCNTCIQAKNSIQFQKSYSDNKVRISSEWVGFEIVAAGNKRKNQLASLRNKIKQHLESKAHVLAENILMKSSNKV